MIVLGVAVEAAQIREFGGELVERLASLGAGAIEAQLSPEMQSDEIARWGATIEAAARVGLAVSFHAPWQPEHPAWPELLQLARVSPGGTPATIIVHGCRGPRPDPALAERTVQHLRRLADWAPDSIIALENGANPERGPVARLRAWAERRRGTAVARGRPSGVGSGMGAAVLPPRPLADGPVDTVLPTPPRALRWNPAGSRDAAAAICDAASRPHCRLAWDLAHDWIAGRAPGAAQATVPSAAVLRRVGYVRVHDVDARGVDHCLLVMGNVPYTTQLRALLAAGYAGTVCLAARYTDAMRQYGDRWQAFERSLGVLRQALKLA